MTGSAHSRAWIDVHVHLAGVGTGRSGCWTAPALRRRPTFLAMRALYGITRQQLGQTVDQDWVALISALVEESDIDLAVVMGFDGVYDDRGRIVESRSQLVVPQEWVFEAARRYANLLPAPSINPYRRDAGELLEQAIEQRAVMIKWLPIVQGFDPAGGRAAPFLKRLAGSGVPVLVHAGAGEVTFATVDHAVGGLDRLIPALEMGVKVIVAHSAAPIVYSRQPSELPLLHAMLDRYPHLWVDNSGLANPSRFPYLPRFAADPTIRDRTLHGSDFPVPASPFFYLDRLGMDEAANIQKVKNPIQREVMIKRSLGFDEETFTRAADVLANLDHWVPAPSTRRRIGG